MILKFRRSITQKDWVLRLIVCTPSLRKRPWSLPRHRAATPGQRQRNVGVNLQGNRSPGYKLRSPNMVTWMQLRKIQIFLRFKTPLFEQSQNVSWSLLSNIYIMRHEVWGMLPVKDHNTLFSKQFLLGCFCRNHPCNTLLEAKPPPRNIKRIFRQYHVEIQPYTKLRTRLTSYKFWTLFTVELLAPSLTLSQWMASFECKHQPSKNKNSSCRVRPE